MVEEWLSSRKLSLAHHKTELIVVNNRKKAQKATIRVGDCSIESSRSLKHLGVMVDDKLSYGSHVNYACGRANAATAALTRIMSNSSAISASKRRLLAGVTSSILRYGGPAWSEALNIQCHRTKLERAYRLICLRVARAYRTVSKEAVCVIAGMMPITIIIREDAECYQQRRTQHARREVRPRSRSQWQEDWSSSTNGRWTHRLIPEISVWVDRRHGEVNFHITQVLSGHGCFRQYLHRVGHAPTPYCPECEEEEETVEHVIFHCPRFREGRLAMMAECGNDTSPDNLIGRMCRDNECWDTASAFISAVVLTLQDKWRSDQRQAAAEQLQIVA
jgi:hypothetical protein